MLELAPYVEQRGRALWRAAWLLTGAPDPAEELLLAALTRAWHRSVVPGTPVEPLVRDALVAAYLSPGGRRWRRAVLPVEDPRTLVDSVLRAADQEDPAAAAVPEPPDLAALTAEAGRRGRRTRRLRQAGAGLVAAAVVVGVPLAPHLLVDERRTPSALADVVTVPTDCRERSGGELDHADFLLGEAAWVRFCPVGDSYRPGIGEALRPETVVTEDAATIVRGWQRAGPREGPCTPTASATAFAVQVGFDDGTVAEVYGETSACAAYTRSRPASRLVPGGQVYHELMTAVAAQRLAQLPEAAPAELTCPAGPPPSAGAGPRPPGPVETTLVAVGAAQALLCSHDPTTGRTAATPLRPTEAERVRVLTLGAHDPTPPACVPRPAAPSYVVLLAGRDERTYEIALSGPDCAALRLDDAPLGVSPALETALAKLAGG